MNRMNRNNIVTVGILFGGLVLAAFLIWTYVSAVSGLEKVREQKSRLLQETVALRGILFSRHDTGTPAPLVSRAQAAQVMDAITAAGQKDGVDFLSLRSLGPSARGDGRTTVLIQVEASAPFRGLGRFLMTVRGFSDGIVDVDKMTLRIDEDYPDRVRASITFSLLVAGNDD